MRAPVATAAAQPRPGAQTRSYSYKAMQVEPSSATPSEMPSMSQRRPTGGRTFSYSPAAPFQIRSGVGAPSGYSGGVRNAASKALGQY